MPLSEARKAYMAEYRAKNQKKIAAKNKEWGQRNPEKLSANRKRTYVKHRESRIARVTTYHATEKGRGTYDRSHARDWLLHSGVSENKITHELIDAIAAMRKLKRLVRGKFRGL